MRLLIIATTIVLVLAGCGSGHSAAVAPDRTDTTEASATTDDDEPTLNDFVPGAMPFGETSTEPGHLERERRVQETIAACMVEQGFEYIPHVENPDQGGFVGPESDEAWVEEYGLGIATRLLEDPERDEESAAVEMAMNPNNSIVAAMTELEREAYFAALHGAIDADLESMTEEEVREFTASYEPSGCRNEADEAAFDMAAQEEFYVEFGPRMKGIYDAVGSDPRIAEAEEQWSRCMAGHGYEFADLRDAEVFVLRLLEEAGAISDVEATGDDLGSGYGNVSIESGSLVEAAVKEIAAEEVAIAKIGLACSADQDAVWREVYREYEQQFIRENLVELEQFREEHP